MKPSRGVIAVSVTALLLLTGCTTPSVGTVVISWHEESKDPVGQQVLMQGATLLADQGAWDQWVKDLPADMRQARTGELGDVTLTDGVAVVAVWNRCTESSEILHTGHGTLEFHVIEDEAQTMCAWSPRRVEVWNVPLESLGVGREDVTLAD
ncbi:hypothetical protein [Tessaracoccus antarcticus]|nr:hypothetical protein [Tessaracoccus antarcticus]